MEKQSETETVISQPRVDARLLWAERILLIVSGLVNAGLFTELLLAGRTDISLILWPTAMVAVPCALILLLLRKNPPSQSGHLAVLFLSGIGVVALVLEFPFVAMEIYLIPSWAGGGVKNWSFTANPFILLAVLAWMTQPSLLMIAERLSVSQGKSRRHVLLVVLLGVILGLVVLVPLFALMAMAE